MVNKSFQQKREFENASGQSSCLHVVVHLSRIGLQALPLLDHSLDKRSFLNHANSIIRTAPKTRRQIPSIPSKASFHLCNAPNQIWSCPILIRPYFISIVTGMNQLMHPNFGHDGPRLWSLQQQCSVRPQPSQLNLTTRLDVTTMAMFDVSLMVQDFVPTTILWYQQKQ